MDEKELSRYYYLKKEIENLEERIITFGVGVSSVKIKEPLFYGAIADEDKMIEKIFKEK